MIGNSSTFSLAPWARAKVLLMGPPGELYHRVCNSVRSLQETDFFSGQDLPERERVSRVQAGSSTVSLPAGFRHWFWNRKPARGFVLADTIASCSQALVFDAWMDERDESLTACLWLDAGGQPDPDTPATRWWVANAGSLRSVADHYASQGLLVFLDAASASSSKLTGAIAPLVADR